MANPRAIDDISAVKSPGNTMHRVDTTTAESVLLPIPHDVFEKLFLNPKLPKEGALYRKFGNPTPVALMGFMLSAFPTGCILMGWRGAGGNGGAILPVYIFFGGIIQILGAIGEWILGNTYSCSLFFTYGTFWLVHGTSMIPWFGVGTNYSATGDNLAGQATPEFYATNGFFYVFLGVVSLIYLVCSIRTNLCLVIGLFALVIDACMFTAVYFSVAMGNLSVASRCQTAAGALTFFLGFPIGLLFVAKILEAVDFPITVPVGDLSRIVPGHQQKLRHHGQSSQQKNDIEG